VENYHLGKIVISINENRAAGRKERGLGLRKNTKNVKNFQREEVMQGDRNRSYGKDKPEGKKKLKRGKRRIKNREQV